MSSSSENTTISTEPAEAISGDMIETTSTTTVIDLLRHGEVEGDAVFRGSSDDVLSDEGWQQMQNALADKGDWDVIITSPLQRCFEFAESLADDEGLNLHINDQLQEIHFGDWEGQSPDDIMQSDDAQRLDAWWQSPTKETPPRGEDFQDFRSRVLKALNKISQQYEDENVLIVTHAGVIRIILMYILGIQDENLFRLNVDYANFSQIRIYRDATGEWGTLIKHG